ncbi:hypothetical protein [Lysinibacillus xylanilyticus]|uniref:hypothetical protein n=1 Tax=Lysinibacillus xylanilyticus TaxID=582475 RepID=UPI003D0759EE
MWTSSIISQSINFVLENLYYLSGIALFIIGIKQINIITTQSKVTNRREAVTLTSQLSEKFYKELVPLVDEIEFYLIENGIDISKDLRDFAKASKNKVVVNESTFTKIMEILSDDETFAKKYLYLTNQFEAFSTNFVNGVADTDLAYKIIGKVYCEEVIIIFPLIVLCNDENTEMYTEITELYTNWRSLIIKEEAEKNFNEAKENVVKPFKTIGV